MEFKDVEFMTAKEKELVVKRWETFLKGGCQRKNFTKALYNHLIQHCSFIAHYDIDGFFGTYFENGEDKAHFLKQFDNRNGIPKSVEYGMIYWYTASDYSDINSEMCRVASKYIPQLTASAEAQQRDADIAKASALFGKHGISFGYTLKESGVCGKETKEMPLGHCCYKVRLDEDCKTCKHYIGKGIRG